MKSSIFDVFHGCDLKVFVIFFSKKIEFSNMVRSIYSGSYDHQAVTDEGGGILFFVVASKRPGIIGTPTVSSNISLPWVIASINK